jgi:hypothetical protein
MSPLLLAQGGPLESVLPLVERSRYARKPCKYRDTGRRRLITSLGTPGGLSCYLSDDGHQSCTPQVELRSTSGHQLIPRGTSQQLCA